MIELVEILLKKKKKGGNENNVDTKTLQVLFSVIHLTTERQTAVIA